MDFEVLRPDLNQALAYSDERKGRRPPFDLVLIFKFLMTQTLNNLSDEQTEYLINYCLPFMRFFELGLSGRVSDTKTIWPLQSNAIPTPRKRIFERDVFPNTGRTNPQNGRTQDRHARYPLKLTETKRQDDGTIPSSDLAIPFGAFQNGKHVPSASINGSSIPPLLT